MKEEQQPKKKGPDPESVRIDAPWESAVKKALSKKRPEGGWPKLTKKAKGS